MSIFAIRYQSQTLPFVLQSDNILAGKGRRNSFRLRGSSVVYFCNHAPFSSGAYTKAMCGINLLSPPCLSSGGNSFFTMFCNRASLGVFFRSNIEITHPKPRPLSALLG
mmetsp:Transcript_12390/g.16313  ORF Transcript_12390/g.16313 Transcript_12390/m.16313 type:complete len:109 (-) Transcript_12390:88-414(-)